MKTKRMITKKNRNSNYLFNQINHNQQIGRKDQLTVPSHYNIKTPKSKKKSHQINYRKTPINHINTKE